MPGRVSDIWRSYLVTRLLWETNYRVAFTSAIVAQYRNPHSYLADLVDERDLYYKADSVLALLANWTSGAAPTLDVAYLALFDLFVERDVLRPSDAQIARAWVDDLKAVGYSWPAITRRHPAFVPRPPPIVDQRYLGDPLASAMARERPHRRRADGPAAHSATGESRRASSLSPEAACRSPHEPLLVRLTAHILTNVVGAGSVVDCGAQKGGETCLYARTSPWRTVHAVEPLPANVLRIMQLARSSPNIQPLHGGLGSSDRTVSLSGSQTKTMLTHVDRRPTVSNDSKRAFGSTVWTASSSRGRGRRSASRSGTLMSRVRSTTLPAAPPRSCSGTGRSSRSRWRWATPKPRRRCSRRWRRRASARTWCRRCVASTGLPELVRAGDNL